MTRIKPLGCKVAVAKSPDNSERMPEPEVASVGGSLFIALLAGSDEDRKPSASNGRIVKGIVMTNGDCEHHHFEEGQVIWYLDDAALQLHDTYIVPTAYVVAKEEDE